MKKKIIPIFLAMLCLFFSVHAQDTGKPETNIIKGIVIDENDNPVPGATIKALNSSTMTISDKDGRFELKADRPKGLLTITFIGYRKNAVPYDISNKGVLSIRLKPDVSPLNEVQVIGYGTTTKRLNTGSVSTIGSADIEKQPVTNPLAALQGRTPGVFVQTQNGLPGGNIKIQIRGQGSLSSGTDPLFIVDGVPFLSSPLYGVGSANGANGAISPFSMLNPDDIDRIDILKDADATAIYGSRGANGVILITTKKGQKGKEQISVDFNQGISKISRLNNYLDLTDYLKLRREAFSNDKITPTLNSAPDLLSWDTTKSTNWQQYFYGGTARSTNLQTGLSGGDKYNQYLLSMNYHSEGTIFPGNENYQKGGGYFNFNHSSDNKRFNILLALNYNKDDNHTLYSSIDNSLGAIAPDFPIYDSNGGYNWVLSYNPVAALEQKQHSASNYLNINTNIKYKFVEHLEGTLSIGYNHYTIDQVSTLPVSSQYPGYSPIPVAYFASNTSERYLIEPQLNYHADFALGILQVLLGSTYQNVLNNGSFVEGDNVSNPALLGNLGAASTLVGQSNSYSQYKFASLFSRVNYSWGNKYLLDLNFRRDGSSRFSSGNQYGNFWAIGGGWIFSDEPFIKNNLRFISFGKIRSSYGTTGNDQISDYQYLSSYSSGNTYGGISSLSPARLANPNYSWETTDKLEAALELGFFKQRVSLTAAWYRHISGNQLISYKTPYLSGFSSYQANFPAVIKNTGVELELNADAVKGTRFNYHTSLNLTIPQNTLLDFPGIAASSYSNTYVVGQDLSVYKSFQLTGIDPQTGLPIFRDMNGDGKITSPADYVVAGYTSPKFFGGWSNDFSYRGFELSFLFEFVKRNYPEYKPYLGSQPLNDPIAVFRRWEKPGDITDIPRASVNSSLAQFNTTRFSDASYIRLKNVAFSYSLQSSMLKRLNISNLKFYVNAENLLVIANPDRFDPEINGSSIPPLKTIVVGIKVIF